MTYAKMQAYSLVWELDALLWAAAVSVDLDKRRERKERAAKETSSGHRVPSAAPERPYDEQRSAPD